MTGVTHGLKWPNRREKTAPSPSIFEMKSLTLPDCRRQSVCRMGPRLSPRSRLSAHTQGQLQRGWESDAPLHYARIRLGGLTIWRIQCTTCRAVFTILPLRLALSPDATGSGPRCLVGYTRRPQFGTVRGPLPYLTDGPLSYGVCTGSPELGVRADPVWLAAARLCPRR